MRWTSVLTIMVVGLAATAPAATVTFSGAPSNLINLVSFAISTWSISNLAGTTDGLPTGRCGINVPGLAVRDATYEPTNLLDAFDNAFVLWVDDALFISPDSVDVTNDTLTAGPVTLSALEVTMEYRAIQSPAALRALVAFHNPTGGFISADVVLATNFGSDGLTAERGVGMDGGWRVTSDSPGFPSDPAVLLVSTGSVHGLAQSFIPVSSTQDTTFACLAGHQEGEQLTGRIVVAPGATVYLLQFARLSSTNDDLVAEGALLFETDPTLDSPLMRGITREQSLAIVNWNFFGEFDITGVGATWAIDGTNGTTNGRAAGGECSSMPAIGVTDAVSPSHGDAFDGGLVLFVDDQQIPITTNVTKADQTVTVGPTTLSGLDVTLLYTALQGAPTLRTLAIVHNPTAAAVTTSVQMATNVGSDNKTVVQNTSSGDTTIATGDIWAITSDDPLTIPGDVVNTHVFAGTVNPRITPTISDRVFDCDDSKAPNGVLATFALTLGPGETQALLFFNQINDTVEQATGSITNFFGDVFFVDDPLFDGMDAATRTNVVNWTLCGDFTYPDVNCRIEGLSADASGSGTAGTVLDKLLARLTAAKTAIDKAGNNANTSTKAARTKRSNKVAVVSLKAFEKMLKSKKAKAIFPEGARTRLAATSAEIRATIRRLPLVILH